MTDGSWTDPREGYEPPRRRSLPRVEDLPSSGDGYDRAAVEAAFDAFYRHAAEVDATLDVLERVDAFQRQASELRSDIRALRASGWAPAHARQGLAGTYAPRPAPARGAALDVLPRIAVEAAFIILVGVGAALAGLSPTGVILLVLAAWLVVALGEALAAAARPAPPPPRLAPSRAGAQPVPTAPAPTQIVPADELEAVPVEPEPVEAAAPAAEAQRAERPEEQTAEGLAAAPADEPAAPVEAASSAAPEEEDQSGEEPAAEAEPTEGEEAHAAPKRGFWQRLRGDRGVEVPPPEAEAPRHVRVLDGPLESVEAAADPWEQGADLPGGAGGDEAAERPAVDEPEPIVEAAAAEQEQPAPAAEPESAPAAAGEQAGRGGPEEVGIATWDTAEPAGGYEESPAAEEEELPYAAPPVDEEARAEEPVPEEAHGEVPAVPAPVAWHTEPEQERVPDASESPAPAEQAEFDAEAESTVPAADEEPAAEEEVPPAALGDEDLAAPADEAPMGGAGEGYPEEHPGAVAAPPEPAWSEPDGAGTELPDASADEAHAEEDVEPPEASAAEDLPAGVESEGFEPADEAEEAAPDAEAAAPEPEHAVAAEEHETGRWRFWRRRQPETAEAADESSPPQHVRVIDVEQTVVPEEVEVPWDAAPEADEGTLAWGAVEDPEEPAPEASPEERAPVAARWAGAQRRRGRR